MLTRDPFIEKIQAKIQAASSAVVGAEYRAELACYFARSGRFESAEAICRELRATFGGGQYARVSLWIMCIEGLVHFFRDMSLESLDRLSRANLLSRSLGFRDLAAYSSAWIAHVNFNFDRYDGMCIALGQCFEFLEQDHVAARGRAAIVLSDAFLLAGNGLEARRWFGVARSAAVDTSDHTLVAALTYNRAALNTYLTQLRILQGLESIQSIEVVRSELGSAVGFQRLAEIISLEQFLHLTLIGIHIFAEEYEAAWLRAQEVLNTFETILTPTQRLLLQAQMGLSAVKTGRDAEFSVVLKNGFVVDGLEVCDSGDRALIAACNYKIADARHLDDAKNMYQADMCRCLEEFSRGQLDLAGKLTKFLNI